MSKVRKKISVTIITKNEQENIERCIKSVKNIANEIVVVDCGSIDKTVKLAKRNGAKVYFREFDDFSSQKNYAVKKSKGDWILSLDADEVVTPQLSNEIKKAVELKDMDGFLIPRVNVIFGAEIKHTRWSPDKHVWLWRRGKGIWKGEVHEELRVDGWVGELENPKIHYQYENVRDFLNMVNDYSSRESKERISRGVGFSYPKMFLTPLISFFGRFFYKKGFMDRWRGFVLSYLMAIYRLITWIKIWEKTKVKVI